jgi:hypothetical protein
MKKVLAIMAFILISIQLQAQDLDLLNRIKAINGQVKTFEASLTNTLIKSKKTTSQQGKLYFVAPNEFAATFDNEYMIVNENKINMDMGMFDGTYRLRDGGILQSLCHVFLYGFQGRLQDLADENGYSLSTKTENGYHIVTGTIIRKKLIGIGYKQVVCKYHADSLLVKEIVLCDYSGNLEIYSINSVKYDVAVDKEKFQF